jgi:hypothetical protein
MAQLCICALSMYNTMISVQQIKLFIYVATQEAKASTTSSVVIVMVTLEQGKWVQNPKVSFKIVNIKLHFYNYFTNFRNPSPNEPFVTRP